MFNKNDSLNLNEIGFKMAFSVVDFTNLELRNDPNFVRWRVYLRTMENFVTINELDLNYHLCTNEDY